MKVKALLYYVNGEHLTVKGQEMLKSHTKDLSPYVTNKMRPYENTGIKQATTETQYHERKKLQ